MPYVVGKVMRFLGEDRLPGDVISDEDASKCNLSNLTRTKRLYRQGTEPPDLQSKRPAPKKKPMAKGLAAPDDTTPKHKGRSKAAGK